MSYYYSVIKDKPVGFWKLDDLSGLVAYDSSGCGNNGTYHQSILKSGFPLVSGGKHSNKITDTSYISFEIEKDFSGNVGKGGFGIKNTGDNDFSLEIWFCPKTITSLTPIFADDNGLGIYWDNGNVVFKIENYQIDYSVYYPNKYIHVVALYTGSSIKLYIDGKMVKFLTTGRINFTNESLTLNCGPSQTSESFIVDAPAIYRYSLNDNQILNHYYGAQSNSESQIVLSDYGKLFKSTEKHQQETEKFIYPVIKSWSYLTNNNLSYDEFENCLYLNTNSTSGEFIEIIPLLHWKTYITSKVEWKSTSGIKVFVSSDESNWIECTNGSKFPQIDLSDVGTIFIKVQFQSQNTQKYIPRLQYLGVYLYTENTLYSHNGSEKIMPIEGLIDISNKEFSIFSRYPDNGIQTNSNGFYTETESEIYGVEFIFTPETIGQGYLFYNKTGSVESSLSWNNGLISKSNISNIYINGEDASSLTNISQLLYLNEPNYIFIKTQSPISGSISFNAKYDNSLMVGVLPNNLYKNISIYKDQNVDYETHYNLYIGSESIVVEDSSIAMAEETIKTYSKDWVLVNNA